ncbi:MAG: hypothetical protein J6W51_08745 [Fibrobacter sp.]|nr:hypothetical protein [Fibrobacter sp.]
MFENELSREAPFIGLTLGLGLNDKTYWALTFTEYDDKNYIRDFFDSLEEYKEKRLLDIAVLFCLQKSQNSCSNPSWYSKLAEWKKRFIEKGFNTFNEESYDSVVGVNLLNQNYNVVKKIV